MHVNVVPTYMKSRSPASAFFVAVLCAHSSLHFCVSPLWCLRIPTEFLVSRRHSLEVRILFGHCVFRVVNSCISVENLEYTATLLEASLRQCFSTCTGVASPSYNCAILCSMAFLYSHSNPHLCAFFDSPFRVCQQLHIRARRRHPKFLRCLSPNPLDHLIAIVMSITSQRGARQIRLGVDEGAMSRSQLFFTERSHILIADLPKGITRHYLNANTIQFVVIPTEGARELLTS